MENSPGWSVAEPWDSTSFASRPPRRAGRYSSPHVARVVFDAMLFQECNEFRLEIPLLMMIRLARDIRQRGLNLRPTDRKCPIAFLPSETVHPTPVVHPSRGRALDFLHRLRDGKGRRKRQQQVNMVVNTADRKGFHFVFPSYPAHVSPQARLDVRRDDLAPLLRGKDAME